MTDPMEFDRERAERERAEGEQRAMNARRAQVQLWKYRAAAWLHNLPHGREFVADDMIAVIGVADEGANQNNVVGAFFSAASRKGLIEFTGRMQKSERVTRHGNIQRVWRRINPGHDRMQP